MTCKTNERFALNIKETKKYFENHKVIAFKADRDKNPETDELLIALGNSARGIPYYAIYQPGKDEPSHFGPDFLPTSQSFLDKFAAETGLIGGEEIVAVKN